MVIAGSGSPSSFASYGTSQTPLPLYRPAPFLRRQRGGCSRKKVAAFVRGARHGCGMHTHARALTLTLTLALFSPLRSVYVSPLSSCSSPGYFHYAEVHLFRSYTHAVSCAHVHSMHVRRHKCKYVCMCVRACAPLPAIVFVCVCV